MRAGERLLVIACSLAALSRPGLPLSPPRAEARRTSRPLSFEENRGQVDPRVRFVTRARGLTAYLTETGATFELASGEVTRLRVGRAAAVEGEQPLPGHANYFIGNDPARWHTDVPTFARVRARAVRPGVDLVFHGSEGRLEYDLELEPGVDPASVTVAFDGEVTRDPDGVRIGGLLQLAPRVFQEGRELEARVVLRGNALAFDVPARTPSKALRIDPVLTFSTYLGGSGDEAVAGGSDVSVGPNGDAYVATNSTSLDFPVQNALRSNDGGFDFTVTRLSSDGQSLVYSTYFGGTRDERSPVLAVDDAGSACLGGRSASRDYPGSDSGTGASYDAVVTLLSPMGNAVLWSTSLGGTAEDRVRDLVFDATGGVVAVGETWSSTFPKVGPPSAYDGGFGDAFVARFDAITGANVLSVLFGGTAADLATGVAVDRSGLIHVVGTTNSTNFPMANATQGALDGGHDLFQLAMPLDGGALVYSTYFGGSDEESSPNLALDSAGNTWVLASTGSDNLPLLNPWQSSRDGGGDLLIVERTAMGTLSKVTYLGGSSAENAFGLAIDANDQLVLVGETFSPNLVQAYPLMPFTYRVGFVTKVSPQGVVAFSTFFGGSPGSAPAYNEVDAVSVDSRGDLLISGTVTLSTLPVVAAVQPVFGGVGDAFLARIDLHSPHPLQLSPPFGGTGGGTPVMIDGFNFAPGATLSIGGVSTAATFVSATRLTAVSPPHAAGAVAVTVTNPSGDSDALAGGFLYLLQPQISAVAPRVGPMDGGTLVTITGSDFALDASVQIGSPAMVTSVAADGSSLTARTADYAPGTVPVTVTNPPGLVAFLDGGFTFLDAPPTVSSLSPTAGPVVGGRLVTVVGTDFRPGLMVLVGGAPATGSTRVDATHATAVTPPGAPGLADVTVVEADGQIATLAQSFLYVRQPLPLAIDSDFAMVTGNKLVRIDGAAFDVGARVTFGGTDALSINRLGDSALQVTVPVHAVGRVELLVINPPDIAGSLDGGFEYLEAPTVDTITPEQGLSQGGEPIVITGTRFGSRMTVFLGSAQATDVVVASPSRIEARTGPYEPGGLVPLSVINLDGQQASKADAFTYVAGPRLDGLDPFTGPAGGGTPVSLTGASFVPGSRVDFGGVDAASVTFVDASLLRAVTPRHEVGRTEVTVVNADGQRSRPASFIFTPSGTRSHFSFGCNASGALAPFALLLLLAARSRRRP